MGEFEATRYRLCQSRAAVYDGHLALTSKTAYQFSPLRGLPKYKPELKPVECVALRAPFSKETTPMTISLAYPAQTSETSEPLARRVLVLVGLWLVALLLLAPAYSQAATATASSIWPPGQTGTRMTNINGPADAQQTSFTGYTSGPWHYVLYPFTVNATGIYTATSSTTNVVNTTWFLNGTFAPDPVAPTTPLANFIVAVLSLNGTPKTGTFTSVSLVAGQQYTMLVAFNSGSVSGDLSSVSITGPGCIALGGAVCTPTSVPTLSELGLVALACLMALVAGLRLRRSSRRT